LKILYDQVNQREDALAERAYAPWLDMEALMREHGIPLYALESKRPLACFDLIGFSLPYETLYTNALNVLDLAGIPVRSAERDETHPIIIAGGHAATNPEPMHAFIDAFAIGEGEEVIHEIITRFASKRKKDKRETSPKSKTARPSGISGVYVPRFYETSYMDDGTVAHCRTDHPRSAQGGQQAHCCQTTASAHQVHRAKYRCRPQPRFGGDHAWMHARVSILPGGYDHASRPRKKRGRSRRCR
jgi:radical SAM superfamily enzyme YgiQ (UPF0313 family)